MAAERCLSAVGLAPGSADADVDATLRDRVERGRAAWPDLPIAEAAFARHVASHARGGELVTPERTADLWLACACATEVPGAASELVRIYRPVIVRAAAKIDRAGMDDVAQRALMSILVRHGDAPPRIGMYNGRAPLAAWLATVTVRIAISLRRRQCNAEHDSVSGLVNAASELEPELGVVRERYGPQLDRALREAIEALPPRQRVLLRLHHAEGWSIDRLAVLHSVGRSTTARWLVTARDALFAATRAILLERLGISVNELESLTGALRSNLEVSLFRLLRQGEGELSVR